MLAASLRSLRIAAAAGFARDALPSLYAYSPSSSSSSSRTSSALCRCASTKPSGSLTSPPPSRRDDAAAASGMRTDGGIRTAGHLDMDAFLAPFKNHERTGVPKGAGVARGADGFDLSRMHRLLGGVGRRQCRHIPRGSSPPCTRTPAVIDPAVSPPFQLLTRPSPVARPLLVGALSNPHLGYPVIHVAGTKGKGSTVGFIAGVLRAAGFNTGTYKSPHVHSVSERIVCGPLGAANDAGDDVAHVVDGVARVVDDVDVAETGGETTRRRVAAPPQPTAVVTDATVDPRVAETILGQQASERGALTYFEVLTALAFLRFKRLDVQFAVVEVGVGGELDATNVFPPESLAAAVITSIGADHWDALGGSLSHIVRAKCGVIRPHRPVFLAPQPSLDAETLLLSCAYESLGRVVGEWDVEVTADPRGVSWRGGRLEQLVDFHITSEDDGEGAEGSHSGNAVTRSLSGVRMSLMGPHQRDNARTALAVMEFLRRGGGQGPHDCDGGEGWAVTDDDMRRGLEAAESPGCFETVVSPASPGGGGGDDDDERHGLSCCAVVADGAHTSDSAAAAMATLSEVFPDQPVAVVVAMAADKDHAGFLREVMAAGPAAVVLTQVPISGGRERTTPLETLMAAWDVAASEVRIEADGVAAGSPRTDDVTVAAASGSPSASGKTVVSAVGELGEAISRAAEAVGAVSEVSGGGVVCVTGSLNTVSRAHAWAAERGYTSR